MLSKEEVKHILALSSLEADDEEFEVLQRRLSQMEEFVSQIKNADVDEDVSVKDAVDMNTLREDEPKESYPVEKILANAPKQKYGAFAVPLMMEDD